LTKIAKKNVNTLPMILLNNKIEKYLPLSAQIGGDGDVSTSNNFDDLLEKIKKYKNNPNLKFGKTYVLDHNLVKGENGEMKISTQNEKQLTELLKYTDLLFNTQYIHLKDNNGKLKKYMILIPNKVNSSEISKHIDYYLDKKAYNTFSFNENKPEISDKIVNNYMSETNPDTGSSENLDSIVNKQFEQNQKNNVIFSKYLLLLHKISKSFEIILSNLLSQSSTFNDKNVQSLTNQVVLALISDSQVEQKKEGNQIETSFYNNKDLINYNVINFEGNIEKYTGLLEDNSKDGLSKTYGNFPKLIRKALNDIYQFDSKYFIPIKIMGTQSVDIFSWNSYFEKYNQYREAINKSLVENDYKSQCGAVNSYHQYFVNINEQMNKIKRKFQGKNATFLLSPSQECQGISNTETNLNNSSQTYDMIKGFKENDNVQLESVVSVVKNLLLLELTITELSALQNVHEIVTKNITDLINRHKSDEANVTTNVQNFFNKKKSYKTSIQDKNLSIFSRISKLKEYKTYLEETKYKNSQYEEFISNKIKQMNFKNNLTDDVIQKLTKISDTLPNIDVNSLEEFVNENRTPIISSTDDNNKGLKSQQAINEVYTLLEFFLNFYKKINQSEEEICNNISEYNLSKLQKCITDSEGNFYPRDEKVDINLALSDEQYKNSVLKQTDKLRIGYVGIKRMYDNYKHIHPFFENQLSKSISEFNDNLDKLELEKKQKLEEEIRKQEELNKKVEIENEANKLKELAKKAINDEQEVQERKQAINNQLIQNGKELDNLQTNQEGGGMVPVTSNNSMEMDNNNYIGYDKVYLDKEKYNDLEYIYLINQGCQMFQKKNVIWSKNPRKSVNIMFQNNDANIGTGDSIKTRFRTMFNMDVKSLMESIHPNDDYSTTLLDKNDSDDYKDIMNLENCSEYRLRCLNKDDIQYMSLWKVNMKKQIQKSRSVWTIQKNIYMTPTDTESYNRYKEGFVSKWVDLSVAKTQYPDAITTLDEMLLDKQAHKRRRALESLIKYATYGDKIGN
jgi:hypothetical protein